MSADNALPSGLERGTVTHHVDAWFEQGHEVILFFSDIGISAHNQGSPHLLGKRSQAISSAGDFC